MKLIYTMLEVNMSLTVSITSDRISVFTGFIPHLFFVENSILQFDDRSTAASSLSVVAPPSAAQDPKSNQIKLSTKPLQVVGFIRRGLLC